MLKQHKGVKAPQKARKQPNHTKRSPAKHHTTLASSLSTSNIRSSPSPASPSLSISQPCSRPTLRVSSPSHSSAVYRKSFTNTIIPKHNSHPIVSVPFHHLSRPFSSSHKSSPDTRPSLSFESTLQTNSHTITSTINAPSITELLSGLSDDDEDITYIPRDKSYKYSVPPQPIPKAPAPSSSGGVLQSIIDIVRFYDDMDLPDYALIMDFKEKESLLGWRILTDAEMNGTSEASIAWGTATNPVTGEAMRTLVFQGRLGSIIIPEDTYQQQSEPSGVAGLFRRRKNPEKEIEANVLHATLDPSSQSLHTIERNEVDEEYVSSIISFYLSSHLFLFCSVLFYSHSALFYSILFYFILFLGVMISPLSPHTTPPLPQLQFSSVSLTIWYLHSP